MDMDIVDISEINDSLRLFLKLLNRYLTYIDSPPFCTTVCEYMFREERLFNLQRRMISLSVNEEL